jgi:hypothetical protein
MFEMIRRRKKKKLTILSLVFFLEVALRDPCPGLSRRSREYEEFCLAFSILL